MKKILRTGFSLALLLFSAEAMFAQQQNESQSQTPAQNPTPQQVTPPVVSMLPAKTTATFLGGLIYAPRLHYYGRTDDLRSSAFLPTLNIEFDSVHIYVSGTSVLIHNDDESLQYAGTIAEAGYRFGKFDKFSGNVYGNKFFYDKKLLLPQSALKEQAGVNLSQHFKKFVNFSATGSAAFSNERTDFFASAGINKIFKWKFPKGVLIVTPTYILNIGSQNFSSVAYRKGIVGTVTGTDQEYLESNRDFKILDHEVSVPIIYAMKHVYFLATPSYIRPENIVTIPNHPELSEKSERLFYVNLSVLFTFKK